MANLVSVNNFSKRVGAKSLFSGLTFGVTDRERLGVIGANGSGKSTLLKTLARIEDPDEGNIAYRSGARVCYVPQDTSWVGNPTIEEVLTAPLLRDRVPLEEHQGRLSQIIGTGQFADEHARVESLSGGWKKRLAVCEQLVRQPDLLLLDEPTNHLDFNGVEWLEDLLMDGDVGFVVVSHDRYFLNQVCQRVLELSPIYPGGLLLTEGGYADFLSKRAEWMAGQDQYLSSLANRVRTEEAWLRKSPKARTTKSRSRIQGAHKLLDELADMRERRTVAKAQIGFSATDRQTRRLIEAKDLEIALGGRTLFKNLSFVLSPGVRLGILGLNGTGKSTLLKLLTGELKPTDGTVRWADNLKSTYFQQHRADLPKGISLKRALAPDGDGLSAMGRSWHVNAWGKHFGFAYEQLDTVVDNLSGGEKARLAIARLVATPSDVLLLDEPANDLDIPTLETLEESLTSFAGAVVIVSHDRYFVDRVCNVILGLDGKGGVEIFAVFEQWNAWRLESENPKQGGAGKRGDVGGGLDATGAASLPAGGPRKKLSYKEQREWDGMEVEIAKAEAELARCQGIADDPGLATQSMKLQAATMALQAAQDKLDTLFARWAELESKGGTK